MKKTSFIILLSAFCVASAAPKSMAAVAPTATQIAQINTEAKEYTGKSCAAGKDNIFFQRTEPDASMMMFGGIASGYINQIIDQSFNNMAKQGAEIRKISMVDGGKRAYIYDKKRRQGSYMLIQMASGSIVAYGCALKK